MSIDHKRPLPVAPERLDYLTHEYTNESTFGDLSYGTQIMILNLALAGEQVEQTQQVAFFLSEAYEIYNGRFRN